MDLNASLDHPRADFAYLLPVTQSLPRPVLQAWRLCLPDISEPDLTEPELAQAQMQQRASAQLKLSWLQPRADEFTCQILHHNDLHQAFEQQNNEQQNLVLQLFARVGQLRAQNPESLWFSAGDDHGASAYDQLWLHKGRSLIYEQYRQLGLTALVPGNHDFDYGVERWQQQLAQQGLLAVVQNLGLAEYQPLVLQLATGRILLLGLSTHEGTEDRGLNHNNPVTQLARWQPFFAQMDAVVVLSHLGLSKAASKHPKDHLAIDDASLLAQLADSPCPVLIIGGHSHTRLHEQQLQPAYQSGKALLVQAGQHGHYLGHCLWQDGQWQASLLDLRALPSLKPLSGTEQWLAQAEQELARLLALPLPDFTCQLRSAEDWQRLCLHAIGQGIADSGLARVVAVNRSSFAALPRSGMHTQADLYHLLPYQDELYSLLLTPAQWQQLQDFNQQLEGKQEGDALLILPCAEQSKQDDPKQPIELLINSYPLLARGGWQAALGLGINLPSWRRTQGRSLAMSLRQAVEQGLAQMTELVI